MKLNRLKLYPGFAVWQYAVPSKKPRGFWHGDNPLDGRKWAYARILSNGVVEMSNPVSNFETEADAVKAALKRNFGSTTELMEHA